MSLMTFILLSACFNAPDDERKITFSGSETTGLHVALHQRDEHCRVYFPLRVRNMKDKTVYAQIRCEMSDKDSKTIHSSVNRIMFKPISDDETWKVFLRTPQPSREQAMYQIEVGEYDVGK